MPIPKKKPITKREIEYNDVTVDNEDATTMSSETKDECFDDVNQNANPTSSIGEFEEDEDLFADLDLDDIDGLENESNDNINENNVVDTTIKSEDETPRNESVENLSSRNENEKDMVNQEQILENKDNDNPVCNFYGYTITSLSEDESDIVISLKINDVIVSNYCLVKKVVDDYFINDNDNYIFRKEWGFPYTGIYVGCVINCYKSKKRDGEYCVEFLANNSDVCMFKFTTSFRDPVYNGLQLNNHFKYTIFREPDFTDLMGYWIYIRVKNVRLKNGMTYSKITHFNLLSKKVSNIIKKLADDMSRQ